MPENVREGVSVAKASAKKEDATTKAKEAIEEETVAAGLETASEQAAEMTTEKPKRARKKTASI